MAVTTTAPSRTRLRRSDVTGPGLVRRRRGKAFEYLDGEGGPVDDPELLARIAELVIPPAWRDVWICPYPGGHIQATGMDQRGRKQYVYHPRWRERRDAEKFDSMVRFAQAMPALRERADADLAGTTLSRERVLACAVRLLDRGFFRIGSEDYAVTNETYGLATMRKEHVTLSDGGVLFDYPAKHSKRRVQQIVDPDVIEVVGALRRRRGGGEELLAFKRGRDWVDIRSPDINGYLKEQTGLEVSAKDFRTWGATVRAAVALAVSGRAHDTKTARKRAVTRAVKEVSIYLGNTPAVARASYIDPRVIDRFQDGQAIPIENIEDVPAVEAAVIDLVHAEEGVDVTDSV